MEEQLRDKVVDDSSYLKDAEQSFVGKVRSIITNTPISKWFRKEHNRQAVRRREDGFEDQEIQPPSKRLKLPANNEKDTFSGLYGESVIHNEVNKHTNSSDSFLEPVAGPSGLQTNFTNGISIHSVHNRFTNSEILSGQKDSDSEESTSGYSSVAKIGSKEQVYQSSPSSKQTSPNQKTSNNIRSLFETMPKSRIDNEIYTSTSNRTTRQMNTSLSTRRPSFNASTFGSPNFVDRTLLTKKIISSPFYNGKTIYGGASAYGSNLGRTEQDLKTNLNTSIQIKPVNKNSENGNAVLGKTARRILETLEQYTSPVKDAKKIPTVSKKSREDGILSKYVGANPYIRKGPFNKELTIPNVNDLLIMKQKTKLQDTTEAVRQIASTSKSNLNIVNYKLGGENEKQKYSSKMKSKVTTVRHKIVNEDSVPEVNLKSVPLPITTLPSFNFIIPPITSEQSKKTPESNNSLALQSTGSLSLNNSIKPQPQVTSNSNSINIDNIITQNTKSDITPKGAPELEEFTFSDPLIIAENLKSIAAINNFKFSEPVCKRRKSDSPNISMNFKMPENKLPNLKPKNKSNSPLSTEPLVKSGSVTDVLGKKSLEKITSPSLAEKFKPPIDSWECSSCLIRNPSHKPNCMACETPKSKNSSKETKPLNIQPKASDKWECPICMIKNSNSDGKCVACMATKPSKDVPKKELDFGTKFILPSDMWECSTCMIRNKNTLSKCASCESPAPKSLPSSGSFGSRFKPSDNTWECSTCLVRNKEEATKCIACETSRSNKKPVESGGFGASFKMKSNEWECGVCMVKNKVESSKCQCCEATKPGVIFKSDATNDKPISTFNFGIDKASATSFNFGIPDTAKLDVPKLDVKPSAVFGEGVKPAAPPATEGFSFGIPSKPKEQKEPTENKPVVNQTQTSKTNPLLKPTEKLPEPAVLAAPGFKFGANTPSNISPKQSNQNAQILVTSSTAVSEKPKSIISASPHTNQVKDNLFASKVDSSKEAAVAAVTSKVTNSFNFPTKSTASFNTPESTKEVAGVKFDSNQSGTSSPVFKFGSSSKPVINSASPVFGSSTKANTNSTTPLFDSSSKPTNSSAVPVFGSSSKTDNSPAPPLFGTSSKPANSPAVPVFGSQSNLANNTAVPLFGSSSKPDNSPAALFGASSKPDPAAPLFGTSSKPANNLAGPVFGSPVVPSSNSNFSSSFSKASSSINSTETKLFSFAAPTNKPDESQKQTSLFSFDSKKPSHPTTQSAGFSFVTPNNAPTFGSGTTNFESAPNIFGGGVKTDCTPNGTTPIFNFGSTSSTQKATGFSFGGNAAASPMAQAGGTPQNASGFSFGSNAATSNPAQTGSNVQNTSAFTFGRNIVSPQPGGNVHNANGFSFGSNASTSLTAQPGNNTQKAAGFSFGGNGATSLTQMAGSNVQKPATFSFGSSAEPSTATQGGFNFGSSTATPAPGGFNFAAAPPTFNANVKPSFNFTGGTAVTSFTAPPVADGNTLAQRKIKKAIRRTQR